MKKDFRFLKVGNKAIVLKDGDVWVVLYANETKSQEFETEAEARAFASKVGNESIDKQEWSMFKGLKKDAEKEIGNESTNVKISLFKSPANHSWIPGINDNIIEGAPEFKGAFAKDEALKWTKEWAKKHGLNVGNKKTGNEDPEEMEVKYKGYTITYFPYQKKYMVRHPNEVSGLVQKHFTSVDEAKKAIDKKAIGNEETKAERKFGKVMGEFEEGALKTPQGKTVTDPAQAKAIAYSEADKVDNLKRARNAMNKKTGNADVTLWKGNDSAYIKGDGTVQYLESNAFETDRDKFESQEVAIRELAKKGYIKK